MKHLHLKSGCTYVKAVEHVHERAYFCYSIKSRALLSTYKYECGVTSRRRHLCFKPLTQHRSWSWDMSNQGRGNRRLGPCIKLKPRGNPTRHSFVVVGACVCIVKEGSCYCEVRRCVCMCVCVCVSEVVKTKRVGSR